MPAEWQLGFLNEVFLKIAGFVPLRRFRKTQISQKHLEGGGFGKRRFLLSPIYSLLVDRFSLTFGSRPPVLVGNNPIKCPHRLDYQR